MTVASSRDEPELVHALHLSSGQIIAIRPARPKDVRMIQAYIHDLSPSSRHNRFLGALNELSGAALHRMTHMDHESQQVLLAETVAEGASTMIGETCYAVAPDGLGCEFAVSVAGAWRRRALGTLLFETVARRARDLGCRYLVGDILRSNQAMIALARKTGFGVTAPIADARLLRIVKDLSVRDSARSWNERSWSELASRSWLNAA